MEGGEVRRTGEVSKAGLFSSERSTTSSCSSESESISDSRPITQPCGKTTSFSESFRRIMFCLGENESVGPSGHDSGRVQLQVTRQLARQPDSHVARSVCLAPIRLPERDRP